MTTIAGNNTGAVQLTVIPNEDAQLNYVLGGDGLGGRYAFTRARMVTFIAQALKPNTTYYPFFNDISVAEYCTTVSSPVLDVTGKIATANRAIKTDALGNVTGNFFIPGNTFASGSLVFRLVDNTKTVSGKLVPDPIYGSAEATYESGTVLKESSAQQAHPGRTVYLTTVVTPVVESFTINSDTGAQTSVLAPPPVLEYEGWYFEYTMSSEDSSTFTITTDSSSPPSPQAQTGAVIFPDGATNEVVYVDGSTVANPDGSYSHTFTYLSADREATFRQEWIGSVGETPPDLTDFRPTGIADSVTVTVLSDWVSIGSVVGPITYGSQIDCRTDPLAQSFYIDSHQYPKGIFLTSIGVYFRTTDPSAPVVMEIRTMENGLPGTQILPGGVAIVPGICVGSSVNGTVPTVFRFTQPIYLMPSTNYCFVVKTSSLGYTAWTSIVGKVDAVTGKVIDAQPYNGTLFKSENNYTWVPSPLEDLKFDLYKANFVTGQQAEPIFVPKKFTETAPAHGGGTASYTNYYSVAQTLPLSFITTIKENVDIGAYLLRNYQYGSADGVPGNGKTVVIKIPMHSLQTGDYIFIRGVPTPTKVDHYHNIRANQLIGDYAVTVLNGDHVSISVSGRGDDKAATLSGPLSVPEVYGVIDNEPATMPGFPTMTGAQVYLDPSSLAMGVYSTASETFTQPTSPTGISRNHFVVYTNLTVHEANLDYLGKVFQGTSMSEVVKLAGEGYSEIAEPEGDAYDGSSKFVKYDTPRLLANRANELKYSTELGGVDSELGYPATCKISFLMQSANKDLSPVIDTNGINLMTRSFKIDNQGTTGINSDFDNITNETDMADPTLNSELSSKGGKALAKYKSPVIKLDKSYNGMKIFVTGICAAPATFDVYIRTSTDTTTHIDQPWTWVYEYGTGSIGLTTTSTRSEMTEWLFEYNGVTNYFDVFDVKIVMRTTNSCYVPKIYGLRTIATTTLPSIEV